MVWTKVPVNSARLLFPNIAPGRWLVKKYSDERHLGIPSVLQQNHFAEEKVRGEYRCGELLRGMVKHQGGNPNLFHDVTGCKLEKLGLSRKQFSRWQSISRIPKDIFNWRLTTIFFCGHQMPKH